VRAVFAGIGPADDDAKGFLGRRQVGFADAKALGVVFDLRRQERPRF
jgi:hypothetical protein